MNHTQLDVIGIDCDRAHCEAGRKRYGSKQKIFSFRKIKPIILEVKFVEIRVDRANWPEVAAMISEGGGNVRVPDIIFNQSVYCFYCKL